MPPTTQPITLRTATSADLPAILELTCVAFGEQAHKRMFSGLYQDSSHSLEQSLIAEVDGAIASYVRVVERSIRDDSAVLRMGGIGSVATHPAFRGQGLSTALLRAAIDHMRDDGYHLSMLFTGIPSFYRRLGWVPFPETSTRYAIPSMPSSNDDPGFVVRPFEEARDVAAVERIYDQFNRRLTGTSLRHHQYWIDGRSRALGIMPSFVAERAGEVVAYATMRMVSETLMVNEAGCVDGAIGAFRPLATATVERAIADGAGAIQAQLPRRHALLAALEALAEQPSETVARQHMMLRLIDLRGLFEAALPALADRVNRRWPDGAPSRSIGLRVDDADVRLTTGPHGLAIDGEPADSTLDLPPGLFFRLFLGDRPILLLIDELALLGVGPSDDEIDLLDALFPPRDPVYWYSDHF